jgi:hypothetical protein
MTTSSNTVFVALSRGYFLRLFEYSGLIDQLIAKFDKDVVVLAPEVALEQVKAMFAGRDRVTVEPIVTVSELSFADRVYRAGQFKLAKYRRLSKLWFKSELILNRSRAYDDLFDKYQPDLVVTASTGKHSFEDPLLIRSARRRSIETLCVVWSWDNLSLTGPIASRPDHLAVWNDRMFNEALSIQKYRKDEVSVVGVPQFDHYFSDGIITSREKFAKRLRLDPEKKIITVATAPIGSVADHHFLVKLMIEKLNSGDFGEDVQLLFRPHPMEDEDFYSEFSDSGEHRFDFSAAEIDGLDWTPGYQDSIDLANVLFHTDVLVNIASTVTLEAAILDTAIVNVAFTLTEPERFARKVIQDHYGAHFKHVFEANASKIVFSEEELTEAVMLLLEEPSSMRENRRKLAEATCDRLDGSGTGRTASLINELAAR